MKKSQLLIVSLVSIFWSACSEQLYTYRCSCNKIAYSEDGSILQDESFNQVICDTTENLESAFTEELDGLAKDCESYFDDVTGIASTDCTCTCEYIDECN